MKVFEFDSITESYSGLLKYVLENGNEVSPRGMLTKEITPATVVINNPRKRVINDEVRKLNYGFMIGELLWILQGKNDLSITHYNKNWANYTDDGETLNGAYGQRIFNWDGGDGLVETEDHKYDVVRIRVNQFMEVYKRLSKDHDSRQGTISMFDPTKDFVETKDIPCTNLMRFTVRDGKLNMMVVMRSNDLWFGYPYDVYNFTVLQEIMAGLLGVDVGKYTHVVDSMHLYETHFAKARELIEAEQANLYNTTPVQDLRLNVLELDDVTSKVFDVENITRETAFDVELDIVVQKINAIENAYWKSVAATIATYNFKKAKRNLEEINTLRELITNEFKTLL